MPSKHLRISLAVVVALAVLSILLPGCQSPRAEVFKPKGELVATIRELDDRDNSESIGFYFYKEADSIGRASFVCYKMERGRFSQSFGGGSDSLDYLAAMEKIGLESFDCQNVIDGLISKHSRESVQSEKCGKDDSDLHHSMLAVGEGETEICIYTKKGPVVYRALMPILGIDSCAKFNPDVAKLKAYVHVLISFIGENELRLFF